MADKPIDLFAALRTKARKAGKGSTYIEFTAPDLVFDGNEKAIGQVVATAIRDQIQSALLTGKAPDGSPLPGTDARTDAVRKWHEKSLSKSVQKRFRAARLGNYSPANHGGEGRFGLESGMLAHSLVVIYTGGAWLVKFAGARANRDNTGRSAVDRVFARVALWGSLAMKQPQAQAALKRVSESLIKPAAKLLGEIKRTIGEAANLERTLEDAGGD